LIPKFVASAEWLFFVGELPISGTHLTIELAILKTLAKTQKA
jgi:hypothetical protein